MADITPYLHHPWVQHQIKLNAEYHRNRVQPTHSKIQNVSQIINEILTALHKMDLDNPSPIVTPNDTPLTYRYMFNNNL